MKLKLDIDRIFFDHNDYSSDSVSWARASENDLSLYKEKVNEKLRQVELPVSALFCQDVTCECAIHKDELDSLCANISKVLVESAKSSIPHCKPKAQRKPLWNRSVEKEKNTALFWHRLWLDNGRPREGVVAEVRRKTRSLYHRAVRKLMKNDEQLSYEKMANQILKNKSRNLWDEVKRLKSSRHTKPACVDGTASPEGIANMFKDKFQKIYNDNPTDEVELKTIIKDKNQKVKFGSHAKEFIVTVPMVKKAIESVKRGKSDGDLGLVTDNVINSPLRCYVLLSLLFSGMLVHGFTPDYIRRSVIVPIPKNANGDLCSNDNYHGISLCSAITKVFEVIIYQQWGSIHEN